MHHHLDSVSLGPSFTGSLRAPQIQLQRDRRFCVLIPRIHKYIVKQFKRKYKPLPAGKNTTCYPENGHRVQVYLFIATTRIYSATWIISAKQNRSVSPDIVYRTALRIDIVIVIRAWQREVSRRIRLSHIVVKSSAPSHETRFRQRHQSRRRDGRDN